jgi:hypothetical protein
MLSGQHKLTGENMKYPLRTNQEFQTIITLDRELENYAVVSVNVTRGIDSEIRDIAVTWCGNAIDKRLTKDQWKGIHQAIQFNCDAREYDLIKLEAEIARLEAEPSELMRAIATFS